eukprot:CAMPEP_0204230912 /NCGR_PEP_ID=MMETSP0361-20130328/88338_1 /ASSEMBLY_ACC=CAM_ASM_000343 /TAXON_ID=268821 /ORGANISM="Scrippsiella Hangoei, Strain SHTV-5" /LENGTH=33 /DNA_ID= /DNA_START= /DNA_END= /DNA_ORIENTATION=
MLDEAMRRAAIRQRGNLKVPKGPEDGTASERSS